ncbi:MAG: polysaccharide biosynthesis protein [Acidobacteria bacterium]|nr:polysaccharide biosynthesis protein [Acidobacteriota bacterium]MBV9434733.1 polysaccharide biosynthesis protein [Acidobacteriota bacterium]
MSTLPVGLKVPSDRVQLRELFNNRRLLILLSQAWLVIVTYYLSFLLRFDFSPGHSERQLLIRTLPLIVFVKLGIFYLFGLVRGWWRYVGMSDLADITKAAGLSSAILYPFIESAFRGTGYPRSVLAIDLALTILAMGGARFAVRAYTEHAQSSAIREPALIVGAGQAGSAIVRELKHNPALRFRPIGFVDDDRSKRGIRIHGIAVLGDTADLPKLIGQHEVKCVLIAIPSATGTQVEAIIRKCRECKVEFKILPSLTERFHETASVKELRSLNVEDLLGRTPVLLDNETIRKRLENKTLLVTGAAGSIGSEIVRQAARHNPRTLVLFERSENDLFRVCSELDDRFPSLHYVPVIGDILDVGTLRDTFALHRPNSVFHAAAYKHVPMMEQNCFQAVVNNIFGTYNVALVARQFNVEDFVMLSSDKAVNPTNIMGVTKRVAELILLGLQHENTRFVAVRFGNVLGSNGSVLPIFQQQVARGGPVTVTHPDAKRYFMTIPEAVQLVLQASTMGRGGEIFILDMGEPIRIQDLARNVIKLSGLEPGVDVPIVFTGLRPGEKLVEELLTEGEGITRTWHEKIRVLSSAEVSFEQIRQWLDSLSALVEAKNMHGLVSKLAEIVPEYKPSEEVLSRCQVDCHDIALQYRRARPSLVILAETAA